MQIDEEPLPSSSSGLKFQLHPLVLINISDHHTRTQINSGASPESPIRVVGCLLGQQNGRTVDIRNSFELNILDPNDPSSIDLPLLHHKLEQYKQTFPGIDIMGWYGTGTGLTENDMTTHRKITEINAAPVFLLLNLSNQTGLKDLPIHLYESELHLLDGVASFIFTKTTYSMTSSEAERIAVDQVSKIAATGSATGGTQLSSHMHSIQGAIDMLSERVTLLHSLLKDMQSGKIPFDPELTRQIASFASRLPAAETSSALQQDISIEACDVLLSVLLASCTKGAYSSLLLSNKHNIAHQHNGSGGATGTTTGTTTGGGGSSTVKRATKSLIHTSGMDIL